MRSAPREHPGQRGIHTFSKGALALGLVAPVYCLFSGDPSGGRVSHPKRRDGNLLGKSWGVCGPWQGGFPHAQVRGQRGWPARDFWLSLQASVSPSKEQVHWANAFLGTWGVVGASKQKSEVKHNWPKVGVSVGDTGVGWGTQHKGLDLSRPIGWELQVGHTRCHEWNSALAQTGLGVSSVNGLINPTG